MKWLIHGCGLLISSALVTALGMSGVLPYLGGTGSGLLTICVYGLGVYVIPRLIVERLQQRIPEGEPCDCENLFPQPKEKLCGTPFIQADQTPPGAEVEQPKPEKRSPVLPLCIVSALLLVCTCILGYRVAVLTAARNDLAAENKQLRMEVSSLQNAPALPFSSWTEWRKLSDAGHIDISYDEWLAFMGEREKGVASSFLRRSVAAEQERIDRKYGPTAYGGTCRSLWRDLLDAGYTDSSFEDFVEAYSAPLGGGRTGESGQSK